MAEMDTAARDPVDTGNALREEETGTGSAATPPPLPTVGQNEIDQSDAAPPEEKNKYTWRFWLVFTALAISALLAGLEASIVSTALPTIAAELGTGQDYVWVINIYLLTTAASQPLYGQLSDLWGRRWVLIGSVAIFTGANAICGASHNTAMLIAGRGIQGIGSGGINTLVDIVICDLVPLRDRGSKVGLLFGIMTIAGTLGPLIGGALTQAGAWRWIFYMNLPLGGLAIVMLLLFLRVSHRPRLSAKDQLRQIDFVGNGMLMVSTTLIQYALCYAGGRYSWYSAEILTTLIIGLVLLAIFPVTQQIRRLCPNPVVPPHILQNRTSASALFVSFNHSLLTLWATYFYPVYFQSVKLSTPTRSGVQLLPFVFIYSASAAILGTAMSRLGRYRPFLFAGLALLCVGLGCSSLLRRSQADAAWICFLILVGLGLGTITPALLPAVQVDLSDADTAVSTGTWAFLRSLGSIWGVSIPAAVFNNRFSQLLGQIDDPRLRELLAGQGAYEHASRAFLMSLSEQSRPQVVAAYEASLERVWQIAVVFSGASFLAVFAMRSIKMRTELDTEFGLKDRKKALANQQASRNQEQVMRDPGL